MKPITVRLTRRDFVQIALYRAPRDRSFWLLFAFISLVAPLLWFAKVNSWSVAFMLGLVTGAAFVVGAVALDLAFLVHKAALGEVVFDTRQFELRDDGLRESSRNYDCLFKWAYFRKVSRLKSHVLVVFPGGGGQVIPRSAFESDEAFNDFQQALEDGMKRHAQSATTSAG